MTLHSICVFCGASAGTKSEYLHAAEATGLELVRRGMRLVYGGGTVGLMGAVSHTVHEQGGNVLGIIPESLQVRELADRAIGELIVVKSMAERKVIMFEHSDGFLVLPGGFGTLDELFEAVTFGQLGIHDKPVGLLNVDGFFDGLLAWVDHAIDQGFVRAHHRELLLIERDPARLLDRMQAYQPPPGLVIWKK